MTSLQLKETSYKEASRYLENAIDILKTKAKKQNSYYRDAKYVRMACGTAYSGVLLALDAYLQLKNKNIDKKKNQLKSVDDYREILSKLDKKLLNEFNASYEILHLVGYYDGFTKFDVIRSGFESASQIINKMKPEGAAGVKIV
jgi:flagellar motility protein MotE (MotC chaperone)